jgi:hypothetical protein
MHPYLHLMLAQELARERTRQLYSPHRRPWEPDPYVAPPRDPVTLRLSTVHDDEALARLATLAERRPAPRGRHVVAEVAGEIVAALPVAGGRAYTDPFRRTAHLLPLLELRARQLGYERRRRRWTVTRVISHPSRRNASMRSAHGSSPP